LGEIEEVDVAIVNTCSFIEEATEESVDTILELIELKKRGSLRSLVVMGCLPQRFKEDLADNLGEVDAFVGIGNYNRIVEVVDAALKGKRYSLLDTHPQFNFFESKRFSLTPPHYAYIKISEGCQNRCSYCIIPTLKGSYTSRSLESIIEEVKHLKKSISEIILVGQDTTLYGIDLGGNLNLAKLLVKLSQVKKEGWIRVLYSHPAHITRELISVIKETPSICRYVDLPLEHVSDRILTRMNRGITKRQIINLIETLRKNISGLTIRTSFIVGFPGEKEQDFKELLDFIREYKFERLGAFIYSQEEGTRAFKFIPQISLKLKEARFKALMSVQREIAEEINKDLLVKEIEVLIDEQDAKDSQLFIGRSEGDAPEVDGGVYVRSKRAKVGDFIKVRITDTLEYDLVGEEVP
jgi:ribosomal protein S12 methylthiotransferase